MSYTIISIHATYAENKLEEIAVMWQSNEMGWVRASYCNTKPIGGYKFLLPNEELSPKLIQQVAGQGMNLPDDKKKKFFPGKHKWER